MNADGSGMRRLTNSNGIDTEPQFSADGQCIYFTSDRGGSPQIYRMSAERRRRPAASPSTAATTSPRACPRTARRWRGSRSATAAFTFTRWTWPAARNCGWPIGATRTEFFAERQVHHVRDQGRRRAAWPWSRSMDASSSV